MLSREPAKSVQPHWCLVIAHLDSEARADVAASAPNYPLPLARSSEKPTDSLRLMSVSQESPRSLNASLEEGLLHRSRSGIMDEDARAHGMGKN